MSNHSGQALRDARQPDRPTVEGVIVGTMQDLGVKERWTDLLEEIDELAADSDLPVAFSDLGLIDVIE